MTKKGKTPQQRETRKRPNMNILHKRVKSYVLESSSSEEIGLPGCSWCNDIKDDSETPLPLTLKQSHKKRVQMRRNRARKEVARKSRTTKKESEEEIAQEKAASEEHCARIKANVEWEKNRRPKSGRKTKKPDWLGHNIMVTNVEKEERR